MRKQFKPELLNRLDEIVVFDPLSHDQLRKVARLQLKDVASRLAERGIALGVTEAALDVILAESYDPVSINSVLHFCMFWFSALELVLNRLHLSFPGLWCEANKEMAREEGCDRAVENAREGRDRRKLNCLYRCCV